MGLRPERVRRSGHVDHDARDAELVGGPRVVRHDACGHEVQGAAIRRFDTHPTARVRQRHAGNETPQRLHVERAHVPVEGRRRPRLGQVRLDPALRARRGHQDRALRGRGAEPLPCVRGVRNVLDHLEQHREVEGRLRARVHNRPVGIARAHEVHDVERDPAREVRDQLRERHAGLRGDVADAHEEVRVRLQHRPLDDAVLRAHRERVDRPPVGVRPRPRDRGARPAEVQDARAAFFRRVELRVRDRRVRGPVLLPG